MTRALSFPFRATWFLIKWTIFWLICFIVGMHFGR